MDKGDDMGRYILFASCLGFLVLFWIDSRHAYVPIRALLVRWEQIGLIICMTLIALDILLCK